MEGISYETFRTWQSEKSVFLYSPQKCVVERLRNEQKELVKREEKLNEDNIARYDDLDTFLELSKNASGWWKKANDAQKRRMAEILLSNVIIEGNKVASVSLSEPFLGWSLRGKNLDGRDERTRTSDLTVPNRAL